MWGRREGRRSCRIRGCVEKDEGNAWNEISRREMRVGIVLSLDEETCEAG